MILQNFVYFPHQNSQNNSHEILKHFKVCISDISPFQFRHTYSTASFDNEGQTASPQEDDLEEENVDSLTDPGDSATQAEREVAVAKIRPSVWAQDTADVRRMPLMPRCLWGGSVRALFLISSTLNRFWKTSLI